MQVYLPFTGNTTVLSGNLKVDAIINRRKKECNVNSDIVVSNITEQNNNFNCENINIVKKQNFLIDVIKKEIDVNFNNKITKKDLDIRLNVTKTGINFIKIIEGVFNFKYTNYVNIVKTSEKTANLTSKIDKKEDNFNASINIVKKDNKMVTDLHIDKINYKFKSDVFISRVDKIEKQFNCTNETSAEIGVSVIKEEHNANFDSNIYKRELNIIGEVANKVGYLVDNNKVNKVYFVEGYNMFSVPEILYTKGITKAYDLVNLMADIVGKKTFELFSRLDFIKGDKKITFVVSEEYITNPDSDSNFDLFEIHSDSFNGVGIGIECLSDLEIDFKEV